MSKETSSTVARIAAKYIHFGQADLEMLDFDGRGILVTHIRALAASALSQREDDPNDKPNPTEWR